MKYSITFLIYFFSILTITYLIIIMIFAFYQDKLIFQVPQRQSIISKTKNAHSTFSYLNIETTDRMTLTSWYSKSKNMPTIIFFHGNSGNVADIIPFANKFTSMGYGFLSIEYRGYNNQPGNPNEQKIYDDSEKFIRKIMSMNTNKNEMIYMGHSMGTGVAVEMAMRIRPRELILLSPFTSMTDAASYHFPYLPISLLLKSRFNSYEKINRTNTRLLILHGEDDDIIPLEMGKKLYSHYLFEKKMEIMKKTGHNDMFKTETVEKISSWIQR